MYCLDLVWWVRTQPTAKAVWRVQSTVKIILDLDGNK